jgi:starvation-inducible DNA-binding protein
MYATVNDLSEKTRVEIVRLLNARLADAIDLQTQAKQAHWNVKGPNFIALHKLFDEIVEAVEDYVDEIAERAIALGGTVEGTARSVAKRSTLSEYPLQISTGKEHVAALTAAIGSFGKNVRTAIADSDRIGDADTTDLFTQISRGVDKWLWFVEAHSQAIA